MRPIKDILLETRAPSAEQLRWAFENTDHKHTVIQCVDALASMGDTGGSREQYIDDMLKVVKGYFPRSLPHYIKVYLKAKVNARPAQLSLFN